MKWFPCSEHDVDVNGSPFDCCQPGPDRYQLLNESILLAYGKLICDKLESIENKLDKLTQK